MTHNAQHTKLVVQSRASAQDVWRDVRKFRKSEKQEAKELYKAYKNGNRVEVRLIELKVLKTTEEA